MSYTNVHRFLARTVASCGVITIPETHRALNQFSCEDGEHSIPDLVKAINDQLRPLQQTIKMTTDELTNEEILVFISQGYDDTTKAQNLFTGNELVFFRHLIEQIMTSDTRQLNRISAINIVGGMKTTFKKTDAEKLLKLLCRMKYLDEVTNNYALGVRGIHEFESYFRQNIPDSIEECHLCKDIVYRGYNCPACAKAIHTQCLNRYVEKLQKWPCCMTTYSADQIEQMHEESSRLTQTRLTEVTQTTRTDSTEKNFEDETTVMEATEDIDVAKQCIAGSSRPQGTRSLRKRKRQSESVDKEI